jgi:hypothetical protein
MLIAHRVNTLEDLVRVPSHLGIEFDVREGIIAPVVGHDPWTTAVPLTAFLAVCHHAFYIVNIKSEGIEPEVLRQLEHAGIRNFFLLDCSFPMIVRLSARGERRLAVRVSEFESVETARALCGRVDWIWVDCFTKLPLLAETCDALRAEGFKLCLVSPELQGQPEKRESYWAALQDHVDAICTKAWPAHAVIAEPPRPDAR